MQKLLFLFLLPLQIFAQPIAKKEIIKWEKQAKQVTIIRDNFGVPHIYGKTDADAVFGLMYAQCEDDFARVELNYVEKLGRMAEVNGEKDLTQDLLNRLVIDQEASKKDYERSPDWLKKLCTAFADGINFYLYKHPEVHPAIIQHFENWYPMMWTDGSIGAISTADVSMLELKNFYFGGKEVAYQKQPLETEVVTGSNGFAFAPKITKDGNAILYINPHVTFYFRPEVQMISEEGLNAYGAVTWGQFFVYQGFNEHCGWMHTSSGVDASDSYIEKISKGKNGLVYQYENKEKPVMKQEIILKYKDDNTLQTKTITGLFTGHGPIMAKRNGEYLSVKADNRILDGLIQCWQRTKANSFTEFKKTMNLKGNISNNTVYADAEGNIAYWHGDRIPIRNKNYDVSKPVDGSIKETEWQGYHNINDIVQSINPPNGWLQNSNSTPYTVAGKYSPKKDNYPSYMAPDAENFRGINGVRVLAEGSSYTLNKVIKAGYDTRLTAFELLIPALVNAFEKNNKSLTRFDSLAGPISILKKWDYRCGENSVATTLAVQWGEKILPAILKTIVPANDKAGIVEKATYFITQPNEELMLAALENIVNETKFKFGHWDIAWGEINRFQRISGDIENHFDDSKASIPVGFVSSTWGMLPSYSSRTFAGTNKRYGVNGNSFICAVEFGKKIKAKSLLAGGESGHEGSPHFFDQGMMYSKGQFKEVLFYKEDVEKHTEKTYHPGN